MYILVTVYRRKLNLERYNCQNARMTKLAVLTGATWPNAAFVGNFLKKKGKHCEDSIAFMYCPQSKGNW